PTLRAQRFAHSELSNTTSATRQQEISDVGASNEQNQSDRSKQNLEERPHIAEQDFGQRNNTYPVLVRRELSVDPILNDADFARSLRLCHSGLESSDDLKKIRAVPVIWRLAFEWNPKIGRRRTSDIRSIRWHDSNS